MEEKKISELNEQSEEEKVSKLDKEMDEELHEKIQELERHDDENGDGKINISDLKAQLDRIEAQLDLQDQQNRSLLKRQGIMLNMFVVLAVVLCIAVAVLSYRTNIAYQEIRATCSHVDEVAATINETFDKVDAETLAEIMQNLPTVMEQLNNVDVEALNEVMTRLPGIMDDIDNLQKQVATIADFISGLSGGNIIGSLLGGITGQTVS